MAGQTKPTNRNRKIEPLNWAETVNSPALKGMMSFLDIKPEEVRSGHFKDVPEDPDSRAVPVSELLTGCDSLAGSDSLLPTFEAKASPRPVIEIWPKRPPVRTSALLGPENIKTNDSLLISDSLPVGDSRSTGDSLPVFVSHPVGESPYLANVILGSVPSQNRKIRKCRLAQDAHSTGEETLYRILWEEGTPESANPLASRTVRIGYAELANRARMHKANVRLNLANLTAKLAIEQSGDFNSRDMIAKSYKVLSYKEILERRRAASLDYVIRKKNVVFVTAAGVPITLPGLAHAKKGNSKPSNGVAPVRESLTGGESLAVSVSNKGSEVNFDIHADMSCVSKAMNTYWTVDDAAADQLIRACRRVRADALAEEIAFFVREKLDLTRGNKNITNPVGLILATVPQSFSGYSFETFRQRRQESKRLAEEERLRKAEEDRALTEWMVRDAKQTLANPNATEKRKAEAEDIIARYAPAETAN